MSSHHDLIEAFTPYNDSLMWRVHHAYFAQRGAAVWTEREIPSQGTSNSAQARLHVRLFMALVADLEAAGTLRPGAPVAVLEAGSGSGEFAANFVAALADADPHLAERTRYLMSDYVARTMREAAALPRVAPWVAAGRIVPALFDLMAPDAVRDLEGAVLDDAIALVITNYVCCALPMKPLQLHAPGDWRAPWVETRGLLGVGEDAAAFVERLIGDATRPDLLASLETRWEWRPLAAEAWAALGPFHQAVLAEATAGLEQATLFYPAVWLDFLRGVGERLLPGGVVVTNDYGYVGQDRIDGLHERRPERFANCLGQEVQFVIFAAAAAVAGWDILRSSDPLDEVHHAWVGPRGIGAKARAEHERKHLWGRPEWAHMLDFQAAAEHFQRHGDPEHALRFWQRCAAIDPQHPDFHYHIGETALDLRQVALAERHLLIGFELDEERFDWEHMLGRVAATAGERENAKMWFKRSFAREQHPVTCVNLSDLALDEGDLGGAYRWLERALALAPDNELARARMAELRDDVWRSAVREFRDELSFIAPDDIVVSDDDADGDDPDDDADDGDDEDDGVGDRG